MQEEIIRVVDECRANGVHFQIVETKYEFGRHYVIMLNGVPGFHNTDLERVQDYMRNMAGMQ